MVLSKHFAQLSAERFTFFAVNFRKLEELAGEEKKQIKKLIDDNGITKTPTLLFLDAETLKQKYFHSGNQDLEPALVVQRIASALSPHSQEAR